MKTLMRVGAVLAAVAIAAPALACQELMQQTSAERKVEQPAVATAQPKQEKAQPRPDTSKTAKASRPQDQKVAKN